MRVAQTPFNLPEGIQVAASRTAVLDSDQPKQGVLVSRHKVGRRNSQIQITGSDPRVTESLKGFPGRSFSGLVQKEILLRVGVPDVEVPRLMVRQPIGIIVDEATFDDVPVVTDPGHDPVITEKIHPRYGCIVSLDEAFFIVL